MRFAGSLCVPQLYRDLQAKDRATRLQAAADLGKVGTTAALPGLAQALHDADPRVRRLAALGLGGLGPRAESAVPALVDALHDAEPAVRRRAAEALGEVRSVGAVFGLQAALADTDAGVRRAARTSLEVIRAGARSWAA